MRDHQPNPDFWDKVAPGYAKKPVPDEEAYQATLDRVRAHLGADKRALEIGCGTGTTALLLADAVHSIVATDVSPKMIELGREKAGRQGVQNVSFRVGTLDDEEGSEFNVVLAFNMLHLVADIPSALRRIHSLLPPGGLFISKTPCVGELGVLARGAVEVMQFFGKAPFLNYVTKAGLRRAVEDVSMEILETGLYPEKSDSLFIVARKN